MTSFSFAHPAAHGSRPPNALLDGKRLLTLEEVDIIEA
jgi:hypothetical protein